MARWSTGTGRALYLAEQSGDDQAVTACAQQLLLAAIRAGDAKQAAGLIAAHPVLVARLDRTFRPKPERPGGEVGSGPG